MKEYLPHFTNEGAEVQLDHTRFDSEATDVFIHPSASWDSK